ncbi:AAA+ family ATPase [Sinisalibacter aestuarii]|uniref:AAA+ family ATPase n=1 Tax=Sinisalibacter aestuarii TaxID=2949426 RepID=A0ABQ5LU88_9RHOB|nr:AAA+ family ATPase [Sinisalibacter aestuarii]GKY88333.1 hypothetical protein STA1M1_22020 [Sinisalibacter aestuarii]
MKHSSPFPGLLLAGGLALAPAIALAQDETPPANPDIAQGAEQLSEGLKLLLRGLMAEGEEGWQNLTDWLDDLSAYDAPERLPNGDIIIRRKVPLPEAQTEL